MTTDATPAIARQKYGFLKKSHKTLLMLRRTKYVTCPTVDKKDSYSNVAPKLVKKLELRHQRTADVVFDWVNEDN